MRKRLYYCLCGYLLLLTHTASAAPPSATVYGYHSAPPYLLDEGRRSGLNFDIVAQLQEHLGDKLILHYQQIGRAQLNQRLADDQPAIVLWANPLAFDRHKTRYLWSSPVLLDQNVVVIHRNTVTPYRALEDFDGLLLAGRTGYYYAGFDERVSRGLLQRVDASTDSENIEKVIVGEVDAAIISKSSLLFLARQKTLAHEIKLAEFTARGDYRRHLLISHHYQPYFDVLSQAVDTLSSNPEWQQRLKFYGVHSLAR